MGATAPGRGAAFVRDLLAETIGYAEDRHWEVCPGTWLVEGDGGPARCSCGDARCAVPGAHPASPGWRGRSSASPDVVRRWWTETPAASVLLPTGRTFDVIDVPETAGCLALARMERMGVQLGPVVAMPAIGGRGRRLLFLVLPGALPKLPDLLRGLGWPPGRLDLVGHGDGGWIVAPPSRVGAHGFAQWARQPNDTNRWLPEASELIDPLAYACGREAPPVPAP
ncbi:bifunctional DNA primase/polymerase [Peterkaempfera sp. SMS 1(5)a]